MPIPAATSCSAHHPGRRGEVLETPAGPIPVYNNVREGMEDGHKFNVGVVHLPPAAVRDGVFELIRVNRDIEKIVILTEKVSVHDAREIRALAQQRGSTFSEPTASAWPMPGTTSASAARWAATSPRNPCAKARSRSTPTPATSPRR